MLGSTNAVIVQGGGGESLVYAYNGENEDFAKGEKGFIGRKLKTEAYSQKIAYYYDNIFGFYGNVYVKFGYGSTYGVWQYNGTAFVGGNVVNENVGQDCLMYIDGDLWGYGPNVGSCCRYDTTPFGYPSSKTSSVYTFYIGNEMALHRAEDSGPISLVKVNYATKEVVETLYTFTENPASSSSNCYGIKFGNRLLIHTIATSNSSDASRSFYLYDISTLTAPVLLSSNSNAVNIRYATGLETGDILFACSQYRYCFENDDLNWSLYTIDSDNNIIPLEAPNTVSSFLTSCSCLYNPTNNIVTFGTADKYYVFTVDKANVAFNPVSVDLGNVAKPYSGVYRLVLSNDLAYAAINRQYSKSFDETYVYALKNSDGKLYAYKSMMGLGEEYITGFATGKTVDGKLEFNGALPKQALTVNVTPEPDTFEIIGEAE